MTYKMRRQLRNRKSLLPQFNGWKKDLLQRQLPATKFLDSVDPSGRCTWRSHGQNASHGDASHLARSQLQVSPDLLQGGIGRIATRAVEGSDLLCLGVVEEAEHVTSDTGRGGLGDVQCRSC